MNSGTVGIISTSGTHGKSSAFKCNSPTSRPAGKPNELKCTARGKGRNKRCRSYKATLEKAFNDSQKLISRLEAEARAHDHPGRLLKLSERGLRSFSSRLVATHQANRKLKWRKRVTDDEVFTIAEELDVRERSNEPAVVGTIEKRNKPGEYRYIVNCGIENRARQRLLWNVLWPIAQFDPRQFVFNGGRNAAAFQVRDLMDEGYAYFAEYDIKDFYPSVDGEGLQSFLPVPNEVPRHVLMADSLNLKGGNQGSQSSEMGEGTGSLHCVPTYPHISGTVSSRLGSRRPSAVELAEARRGIPQGAIWPPPKNCSTGAGLRKRTWRRTPQPTPWHGRPGTLRRCGRNMSGSLNSGGAITRERS